MLGSTLTEHPVVSDPPVPGPGPGIYEQTPATQNPPANALTFPRPARELTDAEVAERLESYSEHATGIGPDPDGEPYTEPVELNLEEVFRILQITGREFLTAQEDYILSAIRLLQERHLWGPRFFNDTIGQLSGSGDDGRFEHAAEVINSLRVTQRLPYGGDVAAEWIVRATDQLRDRATGGYRSSSELVFSADVPLLRGAGRVAREDLIQAERNLVYQARTFERRRRELLVSIAEDYFGILEQGSVIRNQLEQIEGLVRLRESTSAKVEAGRLDPFQKDLAENQVLRAQATLARLREQYILALERFRIRLGLDVQVPVDLADLELEIPSPSISQADAVDRALSFRLDLQNRRDRLGDARRAVRNARNELLPDLDLAGSLGIPTDEDDPTGGLAIEGEELDYAVSMTLGLPLDREIERLALRSRIVQLERSSREYDEFRDGIIVDARSTVRNVDLARFQLRLAEEQVRINERRLEDLNIREDTDPQSIVDAERELNEAKNARDQALTDLRVAVLNYLLSTGQLRVGPEGDFVPLPEVVDPDPVPGDMPPPPSEVVPPPAGDGAMGRP